MFKFYSSSFFLICILLITKVIYIKKRHTDYGNPLISIIIGMSIDSCFRPYTLPRFTICRSYPSVFSKPQKVFNVVLFSRFSILDITCCLFPVAFAKSICVIFCSFRKWTNSASSLKEIIITF